MFVFGIFCSPKHRRDSAWWAPAPLPGSGCPLAFCDTNQRGKSIMILEIIRLFKRCHKFYIYTCINIFNWHSNETADMLVSG